jgi:dTDP-4-amino-4,6-dideoxyglucose
MIPLNRTPISAAQVARAVRDASRAGRTEIFRRFEVALRERFAWAGPLALGSSARDLLRQCLSAYCPPGSDSRVIVPAYCCRAVGEAVRLAGATAVPCDIDPATGGIDPEALDRVMDAKTRAVILIPLFGVLGKIGTCAKAAAQRGIPVIVDSAPVFSAGLIRLLERPASVFIFSFAAGKQLPIFSGGAALVREAALEDHLRRSFLDTPSSARTNAVTLAKALAYAASWRSTIPGVLARFAKNRARQEGPGSSSLSKFSAALGLQLLASVVCDLDQRLANERAYRAEFAIANLGEALVLACDPTPTLPLLRLPILLQDPEHRNRVMNRLWREGVWSSETGYPVASGEAQHPGASSYSRRILTLPVHGGVTTAEIRRTVSAVAAELAVR